MVESILLRVQRNTYIHRLHAEALTQPPGCGLRALEAGTLHRDGYPAPGRHSAPRLQRRGARLSVRLVEGVSTVYELGGPLALTHR